MGYLTSLFHAGPPAHDDFWWKSQPGLQTISGAYVGPDTGLQVSACFAAIRLITETLGKVSLLTYRRIDERARERATDLPLYKVLHNRPNNRLQSKEYRELAQAHVLLRGNHYSQILAPFGEIEQLIPLHPDRMQVKELPNYRLGYIYREANGTPRPLTQDEVFHLRGPILGGDDFLGVTPLTYARETIGAALTMEAYADALFKNGAMHRGMISIPGSLNDPQRTDMRDYIKRQHAGFTGWHSTMVLENGAKWENVGMSAQDAQFLLSRKYNVIEIARWFNIQPHLLRDLEKSSYSNHEQESLEFVQVTMLPHYVNWEQSIQRDLVTDDDIFVEFLLDAILRADLKTRYEAYGVAIDKGFMVPNEVRSRDNIGNPLPRGNEARLQQNTALIDENGKIVPGNAATPMRRATDQEPAQESGQEAREAHYNRILCATAAELNSVEIKGIKGVFSHTNGKLKDEGLRFYDRFASKLEKFLCIDRDTAQAFATNQAKRFLDALETGGRDELLADLDHKGEERLLAFVMREGLAEENAEMRL